MANEWETAYIPRALYPCRNCLSGGAAWSANKMFPENLIWYDGKGDIFNGDIGDVDEDGNPFESDRFPAGFYCKYCVEDFKTVNKFDDSHFGPTLAEEIERRQRLLGEAMDG